MTIVPEDADLVAEVFIPSRAAGFVRSGQSVRIAYDAFPQQKFGTFEGRVAHVSDFVLLPGEIPQTFAVREATYKVHIVVDDSPIQTSVGAAGLRPGMLLAADIILENRNLIDWLLEPLRIRRNMAG
jgi:membrane fusion protein